MTNAKILLAGLLVSMLCNPAHLALATDMNEKEIKSGWTLSSTLALLRNLPLMEATEFPETMGDVYVSKDEKFAESNGEQIFTNTYRFYRKAKNGSFLVVSIVEEHRMGAAADGGYYHKVFDLSQSASEAANLPSGADKESDQSKLLSYIFDNRETFQQSEAAEIAKGLNYGTKGRVRPAAYSHPRVAYFETAQGEIEKVRVHGLATLMKGQQRSTAGVESEDLALEMSVDASGNAKVNIFSLSDQ